MRLNKPRDISYPYPMIRVSKIDNKTLAIAQELKEKLGKNNSFTEVSIDEHLTLVPDDKEKFLGFLSYKYLHLKPKDGIPLLREAYQQRYDNKGKVHKCRQCGNFFPFVRRTKHFCSHRCRTRFYRNKKRAKIRG